jgi:hypothetical protein
MKLQLIRRIQRLEAKHPHTTRKISAIHFIAPWRRRRPSEDSVQLSEDSVPPGARIVYDFESVCTVRNFRGQKGLTYRVGHRVPRTTVDPSDMGGRIIELNVRTEPIRT